MFKFKYLDDWHAKRHANAALYRKLFAEKDLLRPIEALEHGLHEGVIAPSETDQATHIYNQFVIYTDHRDALRKQLQSCQIGSEIYYPLALHEQPCFKNLGYRKGDFPHAERAAKMSLALPIYPDLEVRQIEHVVTVIDDFLRST